MVQTFEEAKIEWTEEEKKKSKLYKEREENAETIRRIKRLLSVVESAKQQYKSAGEWAKYDIFFGGGPYCDWEKYEAIDKATKTMRRLVSLTAEMKKEVKDIEVIYDVNIKVFDRTTRRFDLIFNSTVVECTIKDQISDCLNYITHYMERLELIEEKLE